MERRRQSYPLFLPALAMLLGVAPLPARADAPAFPAESCEAAWAKPAPDFPEGRLRAGAHRYDYAKKEDYGRFHERLARKNCHKEWTLLVYMAADNDLAPYAYLDLYEMEAGYRSGRAAAASTAHTDLLVHLDSPGAKGTRRLHMFQTPEPYDPELTLDHFRARTDADVRSPVIAELPEDAGEGEAARFRKFLEWGVREYPAKRYMVVVWGHGQGWAPAPFAPGETSLVEGHVLRARDLPASPRSLFGDMGSIAGGVAGAIVSSGPFGSRQFGGIAFNHTNGTFLDIPSLRGALKAVSDGALREQGRAIDIYASDACLMQMVEVATELSDTSRFVVGSTQIQNFLGLPYRRILFELNTGRFLGLGNRLARLLNADEPLLLARTIPKVFKASFQAGGLQAKLAPDGLRTITMSSIESAQLSSGLRPALDRFAGAMQAYLAEERLRGIDVHYLLQNAPSFMGGAQDIGAFMHLVDELITKEAQSRPAPTEAAAALREAVRGVQSALDRVSVATALGTDYSTDGATPKIAGMKAISAWLPGRPSELDARLPAFRSSRFYREMPSWEAWLTKALK